ncbi:MAG: NADPH-dependent glutamate synthase [Thermoleophilia bacterium]
MFKVVHNEEIAPNVHRMVVEAPRVAAARKPGQFVIVRVEEGAERIPLTIADDDREAGTITLIIQAVGHNTERIAATPVGGFLMNVAGPLGKPTHLITGSRVTCVGGGVGTAVLFPLVKALHQAGNQVTTIIGGRSADFVILRDELAAVSDEVLVTTEDGSLGTKGFVTAPLGEQLADEDRRPQAVFAVGPVPMMAAIAAQTREYDVPTTVSLNPIMIDGTGMCGGCRVTVGGETKFACVDGPEFDGHLVDFTELSRRQSAYKEHDCLIDLQVIQAAQGAETGTGAAEIGVDVEADDARGAQAHAPDDLSAKERMAIPRTEMPQQDPLQRAGNFLEVNLGLREAAAIREAQRCLTCKKRSCVEGCPVNVHIPEFLGRVADGDFAGAATILRTDNALPATTGRVCPQERQCEALCVRGAKGESVAIGWLERFVADWAAGHMPPQGTRAQPSGFKVAVIGSGPGGLTAAGELARMGHDVQVFEALHAPGGVLRYGIPEFRLPKRIVDTEVENLEALGVVIECDVVVGNTLTVQDILAEFDACFIANGAGLPMFLHVPGENLKGVYSSNEYLTRVNLMGAWKSGPGGTPIALGRTVVVFGAGNTAMDSVRTAKRLGAERAVIAYRRGREEMPARHEEIVHAEEEGIEFELLVRPLAILGDEHGWVRAVRLQRMQLGEADSSGRRRPEPVEGSEYELECEVVIVALGTQPNPLLTSTCVQLECDSRGNVIVDGDQMTSIPGVFAGGDIVRGGATVILAMGDGKRAAGAIDRYLCERRVGVHS